MNPPSLVSLLYIFVSYYANLLELAFLRSFSRLLDLDLDDYDLFRLGDIAFAMAGCSFASLAVVALLLPSGLLVPINCLFLPASFLASSSSFLWLAS